MTIYELLLAVLAVYSFFVLIYFFLINGGYLILLYLAGKEVLFHTRKPNFEMCEGEGCELIPGITIIVPAYNEEKVITESVKALLDLDYPNLEVLVVNDGSKDETMKELKREFKLVEIHRAVEEKIDTEKIKNLYKSMEEDDLKVIDKENGGKSDALNAGLNYSRTDLLLNIDADTLVEKNALKKMVRRYMSTDSRVVAVGGIVRVLNNCDVVSSKVEKAKLPKKFLPGMQVMEYIRAFLFGRTGWSRINSLPIISGAFGLFERDALMEIDGYRRETVGEDIDAVVRLHRRMREQDENYDISFLPDPVCWTQVPESRKVLGTQRARWQRGLAETLFYNKSMIFNPKYGKLGVLALPFFLFFELLGPIIEISGYFVFIIFFVLGLFSLPFFLLFLTLSVVYGVLLSLSSLLLAELSIKRYEEPKDRLKLLSLAVLENFGYRQLHSLWRFRGILQFLRKSKGWGDMVREKIE